MKATRSNRAWLAAAWGAAVGGAAVSACSLGLGSEDSYFGAADSALVQQGPPDGARSEDAPGVEATADTSMVDAGAPETAADGTTEAPDAAGDAGSTDARAEASLPPAVLQVYYSFEDDAGATVALDHSGNGLNADLRGTTAPLIDPLGHPGHALTLDGSQSQYAQLPAGVISSFDSISVACWVNLKTAVIWNRIFDFNAGSTIWMYFSPTGWNPTTMQAGTHFAISTGTHLDPEMILTDTFPTGAWHHLAVVLARPYLIYYIDGVEKARLTNMTLAPKDIGSTPQNWIGRSSYPTDPYLSASIDEFRIYSGALTPQEVQQLASP